jgi:hypothetical protein
VRDEFMITRQGKQYVLFAGLLDEAHSLGLKGIDTDLIQIPDESNGNVAIVKATAEMDDERSFSGIGDASPENVGRSIAPHLIRMAETRWRSSPTATTPRRPPPRAAAGLLLSAAEGRVRPRALPRMLPRSKKNHRTGRRRSPPHPRGAERRARARWIS